MKPNTTRHIATCNRAPNPHFIITFERAVDVTDSVCSFTRRQLVY